MVTTLRCLNSQRARFRTGSQSIDGVDDERVARVAEQMMDGHRFGLVFERLNDELMVRVHDVDHKIHWYFVTQRA